MLTQPSRLCITLYNLKESVHSTLFTNYLKNKPINVHYMRMRRRESSVLFKLERFSALLIIIKVQQQAFHQTLHHSPFNSNFNANTFNLTHAHSEMHVKDEFGEVVIGLTRALKIFT